MPDLDGASRALLDTSPARLRAIAVELECLNWDQRIRCEIPALLRALAEEQEQREKADRELVDSMKQAYKKLTDIPPLASTGFYAPCVDPQPKVEWSHVLSPAPEVKP